MAKKKGKKKKSSRKKQKRGSKKDKKNNDEHGESVDIMAILEESQGDWAGRETPSYGDIPDGKYVCRIEKAEVNKSKASGRLQVSWYLKIAEGENVNRMLFKHDGLDNPQSMGYFDAGINRLGEDAPESLTEIPELIAGLVDTFCEVTLRTKGENQNTFFNKAVDEDAVDAGELEEIGEEEEEKEEDDPDSGTGDDEEEEIEVGSKVYGTEYGEDEPAEVTKLTRKGKATIKYEDGETGTFNVEDLTLIEEEEEEENEEEEIVFNFEDDDLKKSDLKKIKTLAKDNDYKEADFESKSEMLFDIAEYFEIEAGEYDSAKEVFTAIEEKEE